MQNDCQHDERLMAIVAAALQLRPEEREQYIHSACGPDLCLREDAAETVSWEERMGSFLRQPVFTAENRNCGFKAGQLISDRFEVVREIGSGGMGIVYEAFDRKRNQRVAIKLARQEFRPQLSPELESALRVRHPNICLVNEIHTAHLACGEADFLTMELLEGETLLDSLAKSGKLPVREAVEIALQLCSGVTEAHRVGVLHCDLKAANIMLCRRSDGSMRVVVMDFGLAGAAHDEGVVCGTPRYIAPELWQGAPASAASDLYALGVILFEMVGGRASSGQESVRLSEVPQSYARLLDGCLSLDPKKRLEAFQCTQRPGYWDDVRWSRRAFFAAGGITACAIAAAAWISRDEIANIVHPLPERRFVALLVAPEMDALTKPIVAGLIDEIESALSRAEAFDKELLIMAAHSLSGSSPPGGIKEACESLGANLALEISGLNFSAQFRLLLKVLDPKTNSVLRHGALVFKPGEIGSMTNEAVRKAASLLNVRWKNDSHTSLDGTTNPQAFQAFQAAQELRSRPNDAGLEGAIDNYKTATERDPKFALAYSKLALAYSRMYGLKSDPGALDLAEANARKSLQLSPNLAEGHLGLAYVFEKRGKQQPALAEVQRALELDPGNPRTLLWQAQIYARFNRWHDAEMAYLRLRSARPNYWMAYNDLGYVLDKQGKYQEALEQFRDATVAAPGSALAFSNLGELLMKLGRLREAKNAFEKSLQLQPNGLAYSNLADTLRALGDYPAAVSAGLKAVKLEPADDRNWLTLADAYDVMSSRGKQAQEAYRRAATEVEQQLRTDPTNGSGWIWLALYLRKARAHRDVMELVEKADHFGINDVDSQIGKARVLELMGRRKEALATLAGCFHSGMTPFEVAFVSDFRNLRTDPAYADVPKSPVPDKVR